MNIGAVNKLAFDARYQIMRDQYGYAAQTLVNALNARGNTSHIEEKRVDGDEIVKTTDPITENDQMSVLMAGYVLSYTKISD